MCHIVFPLKISVVTLLLVQSCDLQKRGIYFFMLKCVYIFWGPLYPPPAHPKGIAMILLILLSIVSYRVLPLYLENSNGLFILYISLATWYIFYIFHGRR